MKERRTIRVADASPNERNESKTATPKFVYLIPFVPIMLVILMSGKSLPDRDLASFTPPQQQAPLREATSLSPPVIPQVPEPTGGNVAKQLQIIKQSDLITSPTTIVTAYFSVRSKFAKEEYVKWMSNSLSVQDAMVIFTAPEMVEMMQSLRSHAINRTVIIPFNLTQVELAQKYDDQFWEQQLAKDPEKRIHRSYELFWIWLSKSFFVKAAIDQDFYKSDIYMWSDIGCYRHSGYNGKKAIVHTSLIPKDRILQMAHQEPKPPPYIWWNDKYSQGAYFYHSGSQMIGYKTTWLQLHREFLTTLEGFVQRGMFVGEDQTVLESTCLRVPSLCAYVPPKQVRDNNYFGLRFVLHHGGNYQFWNPPDGIPAERSDVRNASLLEPT